MRKKELTIYPEEVVCTTEPDVEKWFAMKVAKANSVPKVVEKLKREGIEVFAPMDTVYKERKGKPRGVDVSLLGNLLFCKSTENMLVSQVNATGLPLIFYYAHVTQPNRNNRRVIIDENEMRRFIAFASTEYLHPKLLTMEQAKEEMYGGKEIKFEQGIFKGYTAVVSPKRHHRKRIVVTLANCMALTVEMPTGKEHD